MNFASAVDHRYRMANGKVVLIVGVQDDKLWGIAIGEEKVLRWSMIDGHAASGDAQQDLVELVSGPSRCQQVGG